MTPTQERLTITGCAMVALSALFYLYEFFLRVSPGAMTRELMSYFHTHAAGLGLLSMAFFWGYTPMQIPAGLLGDRFGPKRVLIAAVLICTGSTWLFATTTHLALAALTRFFIGMAASFAYIGPLMIADRWLPKRYFTLATGLIQMMGCMGAIVGGEPIALLVAQLSWQRSMLYAAAAGAVLTAVFAFFLRSKPRHLINTTSSQKHCQWRRLKRVISHPQIRWTALAGFAFWAPMSAFAELWGVPYLMKLRHISAIEATALTQAIWWGVAIGGPFMGWLTQRIKSRRRPIIAALTTAGLTTLILIIDPPHHLDTLRALLFLFGFSASAQCVTFGLINDISDPDSVGTAIGFNNMAVIAGGIIAIPVIGHLLQLQWTGHMLAGAPTYTIHAYQRAFWIMPCCTALGLWSVLFKIEETHCQPVDAQTTPEPTHWIC